MRLALSFDFFGPDEPETEALTDWAAARIPGCGRGWINAATMHVYDAEMTRGVVVFHDWNPEAGVMCMSAAGHHFLNRPVLYAIHRYIFDTAQCQLAVMQVSERNERMLRIARAYGYQGTRIPRLRGRDEAEIVMTLTVEAWRSSRFHRTVTNGQTIPA